MSYEELRDESRDDDRYRWIRRNVMRVRDLLRNWDETMTPQHFDGLISDQMRDFPEPEPLA